ncbi:MAG: IMP dehydrogenase, partial [Dehalococcoidia bacterium]|nr:IMP dehydrogenase [Dehalococcoidia bacterium]
MDSIPLALTFDDVLLRPRFSSVISRRDVDCSARFTKQIILKAPFVSSNMDT